ncbi:MAG: T9SS type A sorting domain-containing protein [Chitinophagales bacterium]|nr:T9SS type A sorting domain-containing protein [Chitinophagales bacterium]
MKPQPIFLLKGMLFFMLLLFSFANVQAQAVNNPEPEPASNPDLIPACGLDIIFIMDESGSIAGSGDATNVIAQARNGANQLLTALVGTNSRVAIVEFNLHARRAVIGGTTAYQVVDATTLPDYVDYLYANNGGTDAENYDPANAGNDGWTNWEDALNEVEDILNNDMYAPLVIFFTDGKPTAYNTSGGGTESGASAEAQALIDAIGAANAVKALGTHLFIVGLPNPDLPEGNCQAVTGPDRYLDEQPDFTKGDYTISSSQTLEDDLKAIAGLVCRADIRLSKSVYPALVCAGSTVEFTIRVTNDGLEDATGVQAKDYLPSGYTYVSDDGGSATTESSGTVIWDIGNLDNGSFATLKITATVNGSGNYKNVAEVTASDLPDYDSTPNNDDGDQSEDDEDAATVRFIQCDDQNPCTIDACFNGECTSTPGLLDIDFTKKDMSCYCASTQNQLCLLNFADLAPGEQVSEQYADYGIHIFAKANALSGVIRPYVFNTNGNGSPDPDLEVGMGNALIIPVSNFVTNDDSDEGGEITFRFDSDRSVLSMTVIDFDDPNCSLCVVELYDKFNSLIKTVPIPASTDGSAQTLPINASGVREMVVKYTESGAITNIAFDCPQPCCDGSATANVSGGNANTAWYKWSNGQEGTNLKTIEGLCPGTYYVTVTDGDGCYVTGSVTINDADEQECANCDFDCTGECNGSAYIDGCGICVGGSTGKTPCSCYLSVTSLTLMYEGFLGEIGQLTEGLVIDRNELCRFNIRANLCQTPVGSVKFVLNGSTTKIENGAPYAFWGDNSGSYKYWLAQGGSHTLVVTAYSGLNATGTAGVPYVIHFSVTGSANSYACNNPPSICVGGCNDYNACTNDACVQGSCVYAQVNCDDGNPCTADACFNGYCYHTLVTSQPSYLRVVSPSKSWRKLKLGYSSSSVYSPKKNVAAGGNNQLCITLRTVGTPEWSKIQIRPQGSSSAAVTLGNYISGSQGNWTTFCIPLSAFGSFNFTQIAYMELPYSNGANAFEIHFQKIEFIGGSSPFLWFGDPHTNNKYEATSGLSVTLVAGQSCNYNKMDGSELTEPFTNNSEENYFNAFPNPFKSQVQVEFSVATSERVRVEIVAVDGRIIETLFDGNAAAGEVRRLEFNAGTLADGMYFYRLITESGRVENKKLLLAR